jgi:site-specific recombinase
MKDERAPNPNNEHANGPRRPPPNPDVPAVASRYTDPTYNVLLLVEAAVKRLDDLHKAEMRRVDDMVNVHFDYREKLAVAESKRIDAIRAVDVGAVAIAAERTSQQAVVLANQVSTSAETLRTLVTSTAATVAQQLQQVSGQLSERLSLLEKTQYESKGLSGIPPQLLARLDRLEEAGFTTAGRGAGISQFIGWIVAALAILGVILKFVTG